MLVLLAQFALPADGMAQRVLTGRHILVGAGEQVVVLPFQNETLPCNNPQFLIVTAPRHGTALACEAGHNEGIDVDLGGELDDPGTFNPRLHTDEDRDNSTPTLSSFCFSYTAGTTGGGLGGELDDEFGGSPQPYIGCDSLCVAIVCGVVDTLFRWVRITVAQLPDNVLDVNCGIQPTATRWATTIGWQSAPVVSAQNIPLVGDLDGDGVPEIVCWYVDAEQSGPYYVNRLIVFDGRTKVQKADITLPSNVSAWDAAAYGLVKLPNGKGLIVAACVDFKLRAYDITSSTPATPYWTSDINYGSTYGDWAVNIGFADFDQDGHPELYVRNKVYSAETGKLLVEITPVGNLGAAYAHWTHPTNVMWKLSSPIVADVVGDSRPELILGNQAYAVNLTNTNGTAGNGATLAASVVPPVGVPQDGHAQVADFNGDGYLDVFISNRSTHALTGTVYGYVWDVHNNTLSEPLVISTDFSGKSIPLIADIDNDGKLEVLIQCGVAGMAEKFRAYRYNPTTRTFTYLWGIAVDEDSYSNSITAFDFNQDGLLELVVSDQSTVRVMNGSGKSHLTGRDTVAIYSLSTLPLPQTTDMHYPLVVDVDADGHAEIVSVSNHKLTLLRSAEWEWAPARKVWNQYMYNVTNVNENLTIPQYLFGNAAVFTDFEGTESRPFNNFLQQATTLDRYGRPFTLAADVAVDTVVYTVDNGVHSFSIGYSNHGDAAMAAPWYIATIAHGIQADTLLRMDTITTALAVGSVGQTTITLPIAALCAADSITFILNGTGATIAQNAGLQAECDTTNNTYTISLREVAPTTGDTTATACNAFTWYGTEYAITDDYTRTLTNAAGCDSTATLHLTINRSTESDTVATVCNAFTWYGNEYVQSGDYTRSLTNAVGCDSTVILRLTINRSTVGDTTAVACDNFNWYGTEYAQSGDYMRTLANAVGCDSTVTLHLTVSECQVDTCDNLLLAAGNVTSQYLPFSGGNASQAQYSQSIYPEPMLVELVGHTIDSLHYFVSTQGGLTPVSGGEWIISLGITLRSSLMIEFDNTTPLTEVYRGSIVPDANGNIVLPLTQPFDYAHGNLLVQIRHSASSSGTTYSFYGKDGESGSSRYMLGNANTVSGFLPKLRIHGCANPDIDTIRRITGVALPYCENFDSYPSGEGNMPRLWTGHNTLRIDEGRYPLVSRDYNASAPNSFCLHVMDNNICYAIMPDFAIQSLQELNISFLLRAHRTEPGVLIIGALPDTNDMSSFEPLDTIYTPNDWTAVNYSFAHYRGTARRAAFVDVRRPGYTFGNVYIDNFVADTWLRPTLQLMGDSAVVATLDSPSPDYYVEYGSHGFTPGVGPSTLLHITESPHTIRLPREVELYDFYAYPAIEDNTEVRGTCNNPLTVVVATVTRHRDTTVCSNNFPFVWHGHMLMHDTTFSDTIRVTNAADTIVHYSLQSVPTSLGDTTVAACNSFNWYGTEYARSGDYTRTLANALGCDSTVMLHLTVNRSSTVDTSAVACNSFSWYGSEYVQSGDYVRTITNTSGCDSTITLHLTVNRGGSDDTTATVCNSFTWYGSEYAQSGDYTRTLTNAVGCDSTTTLHLTVNSSTAGDTTAVACDAFSWYGNEYAQSGDYTRTLANAVGCDSTVTLRLTINRTTAADTTAAVCSTFSWYGVEYTQGGDYMRTLTNAVGCDSTATLHLVINSSTGDTTAVVCDPFSWYGNEYAQSGDYVRIQVNTLGCDSTVTLHLTVNQPTSATVCDTIVENALPWTYHGYRIYGDTSRATLRITNVAGCDSVVTYSLHVLRNVSRSIDSVVCDNMLPLTWNDSVFTSAGSKRVTLHAQSGADSLLTMRLVVHPTYTTRDTAALCRSALPYAWRDTTLSTTIQSGDYMRRYKSLQHCDSVLHLNLTVHEPALQRDTATICTGALPYTWRDTVLQVGTTSGDYVLHRRSLAGCDSTGTLHLTVRATYDVEDNTIAICEDGFPRQWRDTTFLPGTVSGQYTLHRRSANGCDSVIRVQLQVNPVHQTVDSQNHCDAYTWIDGVTYTASTAIPVRTYRSALGCDSTVRLDLTVRHSTDAVDTQVSCAPIRWIDGNIYSNSTTLPRSTLTNVAGCDSTVALHLTMYAPVYTALTDSLCEGGQYLFNGRTLTQGGQYVDTLSTTHQCDSVVRLTLTQLEKPTLRVEALRICEEALFHVHLETNVNYVDWSIEGRDWNRDWGSQHGRDFYFNPKETTTLNVMVDYSDVPTCPATGSVTLHHMYLPEASMTVTPEFLTLDDLTLTAFDHSRHSTWRDWYVNGELVEGGQRLVYTASRDADSVEVMMVAFNDYCTDTAYRIIPIRKATLFAPNAFTPGENTNREFLIKMDGITSYELYIYNRKGLLVYHTTDPNTGWDGTYQGRDCPQESYVWLVVYSTEVMPNVPQKQKGTVILLR